MKKHAFILISIIILSSLNTLEAQSNSYTSFVYGKSIGTLNYKHLIGAKCTCSMEVGYNNTIGIRYGSSFKNGRIQYETGLDLMTGNIETEVLIPGEYSKGQTDILVISTPFYIRHEFLDYFFFNYGAMIDYQRYGTDEKFGMGVGLGLGAKYELDKITLTINPKIEKHLFMIDELGLIELELLLGISYNL